MKIIYFELFVFIFNEIINAHTKINFINYRSQVLITFLSSISQQQIIVTVWAKIMPKAFRPHVMAVGKLLLRPMCATEAAKSWCLYVKTLLSSWWSKFFLSLF